MELSNKSVQLLTWLYLGLHGISLIIPPDFNLHLEESEANVLWVEKLGSCEECYHWSVSLFNYTRDVFIGRFPLLFNQT